MCALVKSIKCMNCSALCTDYEYFRCILPDINLKEGNATGHSVLSKTKWRDYEKGWVWSKISQPIKQYVRFDYQPIFLITGLDLTLLCGAVTWPPWIHIQYSHTVFTYIIHIHYAHTECKEDQLRQGRSQGVFDVDAQKREGPRSLDNFSEGLLFRPKGPSCRMCGRMFTPHDEVRWSFRKKWKNEVN